MNKIDVTKPLQLTDGTPVEFVKKFPTSGDGRPAGDIRLPEGSSHKIDGSGRGGVWVYYLDDGTWCTSGDCTSFHKIQNVPAVDFTKPCQTRDGRKVTIVATGVRERLPDSGSRFDGESVAYRIEDDSYIMYAFDDGRYWRSARHRNDIINVPEEPERTSEFRTFRAHRIQYPLGGISGGSLGDVSGFLSDSGQGWEGVLEMIREGDRLVDVKFHPKDA